MKKQLLLLLLSVLGMAMAQQETFEYFKWNEVEHPLIGRYGTPGTKRPNEDSKGRIWRASLSGAALTFSNDTDTSQVKKDLSTILKTGYSYYIGFDIFVDEFDTKIVNLSGTKRVNQTYIYDNPIIKIDSLNQASILELRDLVSVDSTVYITTLRSVGNRLIIRLSNNTMIWTNNPIETFNYAAHSYFYTNYKGTAFVVGTNGLYAFYADGSFQYLLPTEKITRCAYDSVQGKLLVYTDLRGYMFKERTQQAFEIPYYDTLISSIYYRSPSIHFKSGITHGVMATNTGFNISHEAQSTTFLFAKELPDDESLEYISSHLQEDSTLMIIYVSNSTNSSYLKEIFVFAYKNNVSKLLKRTSVANYSIGSSRNIVGYYEGGHLYIYTHDSYNNKIYQFKDDVVTDIPYRNSNCSNYIMNMAVDRNYLWISNEASPDSPCAIARMAHDTYFVRGKVFYDMNANGVKDASELWYDRIKLVAKPYGLILLPDLLGNFAFQGEAGETYTIAVLDSSLYSSIKTEATTGYIGVKLKVENPEVSTSFWLPRARCGTNRPSTFSLHNYGLVPVERVVVRMIPQNMQLLKDSILVDTAVFSYQNLAAGQYASVSYNIEWPDASQVGQTATLKTITELYVGGVLASTKEDSIQTIIRCSYDPNDKSVTPVGLGNEAFTLKKNALKYVIRFENTGNDTAYNIVIKDTLSKQLDWSTLVVLGSSHIANTEISKDGVISFHFNNIMLPDTGTNKEKAQGYVSFTVAPKFDVAENTFLCNKAAIYFDENPPVITNSACNTLVDKLPTVVRLTDTQLKDQPLHLYPNPAQDWVQLPRDVQSIIVYNALGEEVLQSSDQKLDLTNVSNGVYMVRTVHQNGAVSTQQLSVLK